MCPPPQTSRRAVEKAGTRAGTRSASLRPARETNQSAQAGPAAPCTWDSLPGWMDKAAWVPLRRSGARKNVLLEATRDGGPKGLRISPPPRGHAGRPLHHAEKVPSPARPPWRQEEASSQGPSSSLCESLRARSEGRKGGDSAWTYLELQASRAPVAFRSAPAPPIPRRSLHLQPHSP